MGFRRFTSLRSTETSAETSGSYSLKIKPYQPKSLFKKLAYTAVIFSLGAGSLYSFNAYNRSKNEDKGVLEVLVEDLSSVKDYVISFVEGRR